MPGTLEKISDDELAPGDVRKRRGTIKKLAAMYNAWLNPQIIRTSGKDALTLSESNVTLELQDDPAVIAAASRPTPFQLLQTAAGANGFLLNANSYLRADVNSFTSTPMTNSTSTFVLAAGDIVYLELDTNDGVTLQEASIVKNQTGPGDKAVTSADYGDGGGAMRWDQSFCLLAQVFAAAADGSPAKGGIVYTVDAQTPPTRIEVVQCTFTHLALQAVNPGGVYALQAFPSDSPLIS